MNQHLHFTPDLGRRLLDVARDAIRSTLAHAPAAELPTEPDLRRRAGCFVTLHRSRDRRLRGCVGQMEAKGPLVETVAAMATSVLEDPRFLDDPVRLAELPELDIELSILSPLLEAADTLQFDLSEGIYLTHGDRAGCFLPQVARETGWSKEELLARLCTEKMGLPSIAWRHPAAKLFRFTTLEIGPEPFVPPP